MVVGSEGGNDFASSTIAFAHGIETPVIKWDDEDMRKKIKQVRIMSVDIGHQIKMFPKNMQNKYH